MKPSIFHVKQNLDVFGFWYVLHTYGLRHAWTIYCAHKMLQRERRQR